MLVGHSMDQVSMPKVPGCHTTFADLQSIHAVDTISVLLGPIMQFFRKWVWLHNIFKFEEKGGKYAANKSNKSGYKFIALTKYDKAKTMLRNVVK